MPTTTLIIHHPRMLPVTLLLVPWASVRTVRQCVNCHQTALANYGVNKTTTVLRVFPYIIITVCINLHSLLSACVLKIWKLARFFEDNTLMLV
jgi:hypothetical protein